MVTVILIDDERPALRELEYILNNTSNSNVMVLGSFVNPMQGVDAVAKQKPDAVFLDINMPQLNGIDIASLISEKSPDTRIVFITAYDQYAVKAFELNALDYLLKPISRERLQIMLDRLTEYVTSKRRTEGALPMRTLYIDCLGGFSVYYENQPPVRWHSKKAGELFAFLLYKVDKPPGREEILDALWPGIDPLISSQYLDDTIYSLRKSLLEYGVCIEQVSVDNDCRLSLKNIRLDVDSFSESFEKAREYKTYEYYDECIKQYTGKYLEDCGWPWAEEYSELLNRQYISIVFNMVKTRILSSDVLTPEESDSSMQLDEELIYQYLSCAKLKLSNKGFQYCASAIKLACENPQLMTRMEDLYEKVGELYGENAKNISRTIRYALSHLNTTNKEFLSKAVYEVQFSLNKH
ncbi:MAG TPA: response regulator [Clostridiales bacterium]|jgi:two-component system LytT family response regulator|nr:response regulator [Clostridiales bacterium]